MTPASENCDELKDETDSFVDRAMDINLASRIDRALRRAIGRTSSNDTYMVQRCPLSRAEEQSVVDALRLLSHRIGHGLTNATEPLSTIEPFLLCFGLSEAHEEWADLDLRVRARMPVDAVSPA